MLDALRTRGPGLPPSPARVRPGPPPAVGKEIAAETALPPIMACPRAALGGAENIGTGTASELARTVGTLQFAAAHEFPLWP